MKASARRAPRLLTAVMLAAWIAGCARGGEGLGGNIAVKTLEEIEGTWVLEAVYSSPRPLVEGVPVQLTIEDGRFGLDAGCNSIGAIATVEDSRLVASEWFSTAMACGPEGLMEQELWIAEFFQSRPVLERGGPVLTANTDVERGDDVSGEDVSLSFTRSESPTDSPTP